MNLKIVRSILTKNDCYLAGKALAPRGIVIHSTGVDQKRVFAYTSQWNRPGVSACVHGFLGLDGDGKLCFTQTLPYEMRCWGCGSGSKGSYNDSHIQFEICETLADGVWCRETYAAALELCAELCRIYNIEPEQVVCHSEAHALGYASNHADVMHWWPKHGCSMDGFRRELKALLEAPVPPTVSLPQEKPSGAERRFHTVEEIPAALRPETEELIASGALQGRGGTAGLDLSEDMLRTMIVCKRYTDRKEGAGT